MTIKILKNQLLDIDYVENPEVLPYVDIIVRDGSNGRIQGWFSLDKENTEEVIKQLQRMLPRI